MGVFNVRRCKCAHYIIIAYYMTTFEKLEYLIYTSHKTASQTIECILEKNGIVSKHCHKIKDLKHTLPVCDFEPSHETFINKLINYKLDNHNKLKIITVVRNPQDRLISSFFQSAHTDEVYFNKIPPDKTTVVVNSEEDLSLMYERLIKTRTLLGFNESIDEMSSIFNFNIHESLEFKNSHYYLNHELFELYVLDFNELISVNVLIYLNSILNTDLTVIAKDNLSSDKCYFNKYNNVKKLIGTTCNEYIENSFDKFYFNSFAHNK
jgi:hypothetical protein